MKAALGIFLAIMAGGGANAGPDGKEVPRVAFLGFEFINTSLEATARVEVERIRLLDDVLRQKLTASSRFEILDIPPDTIKEIASGPTISALHSISRSARTSSDGGTSRPSAFAVLRLITNSNFVACSTGKSPGLAPLKILSMKVASRRKMS
jgi:hypothetical protein